VQVKIERKKMLKKFLFICFLLSIISCHKSNPAAAAGENQQPAATSENKWIAKANMPTARGYFCGAEVDGKIYLFGGLLDLSFHNSNAVEVYDPETDSWTTKNKMPETIFGQAAVELNGKIYIFGGRTGDIYNGTTLNYTYLYDPVADSWTKKTDMPLPRAFLTASVIDNKIYLIGGSSVGYEGSSTVLMYDPASDMWITKARLPRPTAGHTANVFNGKIYVIGGGISHDN
jgi:N-acetylneuraminic acid mutarotase